MLILCTLFGLIARTFQVEFAPSFDFLAGSLSPRLMTAHRPLRRMMASRSRVRLLD
jgi:hypothetical protein